MKIVDISWPVSEKITQYKDKKNIKFIYNKKFKEDGSRDSAIFLDSHTGTHVDAPAHFLKNGKTVDKLDLSSLIGDCKLLDLTKAGKKIKEEHLKDFDIAQGDIVLLKTKNSYLDNAAAFEKNFVFLEASGASYLVDQNIKAVGIDYLGLERGQKGHPSHVSLMKKEIPIIKGLRLKDVEAGGYFFCCLPVYVVGLEASLARAVLIQM